MEAAKTLKGDKQFFRPWEPRMNPETFPRSGNNAITFYDSKQTEDVPKKLQPKFQEPEQLINRTSQVLADKVSPTLDEYSSSFQLNKHFQQLGMLYFGGNFGRNFLENDPNLNPSATITQNSHPFRLASSGNSLLSEHENSFPKKYASSNVNFSRRHLFNAWDNKIFQISQFLNFQNSLKLPRGMAATQHMNNVKMHSINGNSQSLLTPESVQCLKKGWSGASVGTATALDLTRTSAKNDKKIFSCKICDKTYSSLGALKMHIRTHTLPCKCHICGKAFSRPWLLQGHIRTHTGEKPFVCNQCDRAFADRSNLRAHLQTHEDKKKFACKQENCGKTFSRASLLEKHICGGSNTDKTSSDTLVEGAQKTTFAVQ